MIFTYEKCLITFKKWFHIIFISENFVVAEFCFESNIKNFITCSECDLKLSNWKLKRNFMKIHTRQSSNCLFVQTLNEKNTSRKSKKHDSLLVSIIETSFSSSSSSSLEFLIFYLIIIDLYRKQKILLVKVKENVKTFIISYEQRLITYNDWFHDKSSAVNMIVVDFIRQFCIKNITSCSKCLIIFDDWFVDSNSLRMHFDESDCSLTKAVEQETIVVRKQSSKIKFRNFSESFKSEKFTINFSSISTISDFERIIKSNVILVENSIFTSTSKNLKVIFSRSISSCSTSTILLINQSSYLFVANQFIAHILYQHIVMTFFFSYNKRLMTFKKWFHTSSTSKALIQTEFRYTSIKLSLNCITCRRCDLIFEKWEFHNDFIKEHFRRNSECSKAKTIVVVVKKIIEAAKSDVCFKDIDFFDFTMQTDFWEKFRISINIASFLHHLIETIVKYREKNITKFFFQCLRDSAL